jgi:hypothetical protein
VPRNAFTLGSVLLFDRIRNSVASDIKQTTAAAAVTSVVNTTDQPSKSSPIGLTGLATLDDGLHVQRVMDACRVSSDTGVTVAISTTTTTTTVATSASSPTPSQPPSSS